MHRIRGICAVVLLAVTACSSDSTTSSSTTAAVATTVAPATPDTDVTASATTPATDPPVTEPVDTTPAEPVPADATTVTDIETVLAGAPAGCDPLDARHCLLPFPSNSFLRDGRVAFPAEGMPSNAAGVAIDPAELNPNDGFSPNTPILTYVEGLDAEASNLPSWTDLGASLDDATVVLVDVESGERIALWAELDAKAKSDADRLLEIHPAISLLEGHTFAVGLRGMVGADGEPIEPAASFAVYRDGLTTELPEIEDRRADMESTFAALGSAGIERDDLQLAWSFTVATTEDISGRMLHIRDEALAGLGNVSPAFTVTSTTPNTDDNIALQIEGTYMVPNYLTGDGAPGNSFSYGDGVVPTGDEMPVQNGMVAAPFVCNVSVATAQGTEMAHLVQYGHGLLGSNHEIDAGNVRAFANEHNVVFCATKWAGMSEDDIGNAAATLADMGNFDTMADRLQQGVLNQIFLGRLMTAADGLVTDPSLQRADGSPMIDTAHLDYDGNSQGGIMGLMLAAVSPDIERATLGVAGMNYSLLLSRSVDFATYEAIFAPAYPNDLDRVLILGFTQMLWDRGEGAGYVQHVTADPYGGTTAKPILIHVALGDHQVSELTALIMARTVGATIHRPVVEDGRSDEVEPGWGLETTEYPSTRSGIVIWDSGAEKIPIANLPPDNDHDPHEDPRADPDVRDQKAAFLFDDTLVDVCGGSACTADARD